MLFISLFSLFNPSKIVNIETINGRWEGMYNTKKVILVIRTDSSCFVELQDLLYKANQVHNGECSIDISKAPNSLIIKNVNERPAFIFSLIRVIDSSMIHISSFSTQAKLRPLVLTAENTIILKKIS